MALKSIFKLSIIIILIITILNCSYADTGPYIGENQAKKVAQNYLNSHNLPYTATTVTEMILLDDYWKTNHTKWVSSSQLEVMRKNNETFEGEPVDNYVGSGTLFAWKVHVVNSQGKKIGNIWIDTRSNGEIIKIDLQRNNQNKPTNTNNTSNQTMDAINITAQNSQGPLGNNTGLIFSITVLLIVAGAGYLMYTRI